MAWLTSLLKKPEVEEGPELLETELPPEPAEPIPTGPQLAVLVPDMAGISSFRIRTLPDAPSAAEHIASLRAEVRHDTHAFWALHDKPIVDESAHVEALVLIRAQSDSDLVYVVSFLDLESALSFTRFEVRRGLYLGNVMIYWAAFTQLREELDGVSITPDFAPPTENYVLPIVPEAPLAPQPAASVAVAEPEPETVAEPAPETAIESEAREAVERYLRKKAAEPGPRILDSIAAAEAPAIDKPRTARDPETIRIQPTLADAELGAMWPEAQTADDEPELDPEPELISPVAAEQAAINEAFVFQHRSVAFRPLKAAHSALETAGEADGLLVDHQAERIATFATDSKVAEQLAARLGIGEPEPTIETIPGDEEMDPAQFVAFGSVDANGLPPATKLDDFDVAYEVERLLRNRKWEQRDGPFSGFQSPPGRF